MSPKGSFNHFTIFKKIIVIFIVVISPIYILGVYMNMKGSEVVEGKITDSLKQQVQYNLLFFESDIRRTSSLQRELFNDYDLQELSMLANRMSPYEQNEAIKRLQSKLRFIKESSLYVNQASVYIPAIERIISSNHLINKLEQETLEKLKVAAKEYVPPFVHDQNFIYLRDFYPNSYHLAGLDPNFVLELKISDRAIDIYLGTLADFENSGVFLVHGDHIINNNNVFKYEKLWKEVKKSIPENVEHGMEERESDTLKVMFDKQIHYVQYAYSKSLNSFMVVYIPEGDVIGPIIMYRYLLWGISVISLIIVIVFAYWIFKIIHRPLRELIHGFKKIEAGDVQFAIAHKGSDEFHYLYGRFNFMLQELDKLINQSYQQKIHLQQSELKQLQSQINPHFLYNSFYLLYRMTKAKDFENATKYTKYLGDYYQYITKNGKEEVSLQEELEHVKTYAEIQSIRSNGKFKVIMEVVSEKIQKVVVPRLILQPIAENAFKHGFNNDLENYALKIISKIESNNGETNLVIIFKDNGNGMSKSEINYYKQIFFGSKKFDESTGIINVHRRLQLKYGDSAGIELLDAKNGVVVRLIIPF